MKVVSLLLVLILTAAAPAFAVLKKTEKAPDFSLPDRLNRPVSLSSLLAGTDGEKRNGIVLSFFATWCEPCREELPILNAATEELARRGIAVVLVNIKESSAAVDYLLKELKVDRPFVLSDRDGAVTERYQVWMLPVTFFIGKDGTVKDVNIGAIKDKAQLLKSAGALTPER